MWLIIFIATTGKLANPLCDKSHTMPSHYDWNDLYFFLAVARAGRLTEAARRLGVEHSTVSRRVFALESALGTQLFERRPTGYSLTASGEQLLHQAEDIENLAGSILSTVGGADIAVSGTVRIGAPEGVGTFFLAPRLHQLTLRHPGLDVELIAMPRIFNLSKREADIAIGLSRPSAGRLHGRELTDYELGVYASADYVKGRAPIEKRSDLAAHCFIGYAEDFIFTPELDYVPGILRELRPAIRSSSIIAQLEATAAGAGLCVLPCFMTRNRPALVRVLPDEIRLKRTFWLITHSDAQRLARVRTALDFLVHQVRSCADYFVSQS